MMQKIKKKIAMYIILL